MAANRPRPTLADYVAIAISPALIMVLVASLVLFLLEIVYLGQYETRLRWILFCFIFAAVLIARIAMTPGIAERASLYGLVLAVVVFVALQLLVQYPPGLPVAGFRWAINLGLIAVIWWCAHKLTWDCTLIDENVDASGAGLLEAAGLEKRGARDEGGVRRGGVRSEEKQTALPTPHSPLLTPNSSRSPSPLPGSGLFAWWERYRRYREEQQQQPHAPGVWIVYFSLAALPLFGLGEWLIPADDSERRQRVFWFMVYYVASALGLLLSTSFLGLRRYLRQRKLKMPVAITGVWLMIGAVLITVLLVVGAFLPRPNPEYSLMPGRGWLGSPERGASRYAVMNDSPGKGEGRPGAAGKDGRAGASSTSGSQGEGGGTKGEHGAGGSGKGQSGSGQGKGEQGSRGGSSSGKSGSGQNNSQSGSGGNQQGQPGQGKSGNQSNQPGSQGRSGNGERTQPGNQNGSQGNSNQGKGNRADPAQAGKGMKQLSESESAQQAPANPSPASTLSSLFHSLGRLLKWLVFAIAALIAAFIVLRAVLKFLANFTGWARGLLNALQGLWQGLFGWLQPATSDEPEEEAMVERRRVPFAAFRDPFADGSGGRQAPEDLVRYSFRALEAWAWEHDLGRQADDTPLEFADRVALNVPEALATDCRRLAVLYARAAYSREPLPGSCLTVLRQFWRHLTEENRVSVSGSR